MTDPFASVTETQFPIRGVDTFTLFDLYRKVAEHKGITFSGGRSILQSKPIFTFPLSSQLLEALAQRWHIRRQHRTDTRAVTSLVLQLPGEEETDGWSFKRKGDDENGPFDFSFDFYVEFSNDRRKRCAILLPKLQSTMVSTPNQRSIVHLMTALVAEYDGEVPALAKEFLDTKDHTIRVPWADVGLKGIRTLAELFEEFSDGKSELHILAQHRSIFEPNPLTYRWGRQQEEGEVWVTETSSVALLAGWGRQLKDYIQSIQLPG